MGMAKAIADRTQSHSNIPYPTQDIYTPEDEAEYCAGYTLGLQEFDTVGIQTCMWYETERGEKIIL